MKMKGLSGFVARAIRRLGGFAINQVLLAVASLLLVPAVIGAGGLTTWSSIALGQSLAQIVATVVGCGYGVIGPSVVATSTLEESVSYFRLAERTRLVVAVPCFTFMIVAMFVIPNPNPIAGLLGGAQLALGAFSATFFYVGRSAPLWLLFAETGPRVTFTLAGALSLTLGAPLLLGLALPPLGTVIGIGMSNLTIRRLAPKAESAEMPSLRAELRSQLAPGATSILRGGRDALPVLVVTAVSPQILGAFGLFDRLARQAVGVLTPLNSTLQGWVPRRIATQKSARPAVTALLAGAGVAAVIYLMFAATGSFIVRWMAAGTLTPTFGEIALCGAVIATAMLIPIVAYACLVPLGGIRGVILGSVVGIVAVVITLPAMLSIERSVSYALAGLLTANVVQLTVQLAILWYLARKGVDRSGSATA